MRLLPREEKFFHYFVEQSQLILQAARMLHTAAKQGNSALAGAAQEIEKLEQRGDEIIHEIFTKLNQTFITPLDPEDIHSLGSHLDDVLDAIEETVHRMVAYEIGSIPQEIIEFANIIEACAVSLEKAFEALRVDKPLLDHCIEINRLELAADKLGREVIAKLFRQETNPIALIKLKEIYEFLELTTDYCEDVADALQNVIVKNS
jgi:predicted phosphate transport protein (TIGR00153 family)